MYAFIYKCSIALHGRCRSLTLHWFGIYYFRAMDSLRVPPGDAKTAVLSGGEKRRVSLCQLLLESHDMLLLDEVGSAASIGTLAIAPRF